MTDAEAKKYIEDGLTCCRDTPRYAQFLRFCLVAIEDRAALAKSAAGHLQGMARYAGWEWQASLEQVTHAARRHMAGQETK